MKKTGRPSKLTPEITERFLTAIKLGATYQLACAYAGITYKTFSNWREQKGEDFLRFFQHILEAEGQAAIRWLAQLEKHSHADGKWAAWKLERRYPQGYGRQDKLTIDVNQLNADIETELGKLARVAAGSEADTSSEAEGETIH